MAVTSAMGFRGVELYTHAIQLYSIPELVGSGLYLQPHPQLKVGLPHSIMPGDPFMPHSHVLVVPLIGNQCKWCSLILYNTVSTKALLNCTCQTTWNSYLHLFLCRPALFLCLWRASLLNFTSHMMKQVHQKSPQFPILKFRHPDQNGLLSVSRPKPQGRILIAPAWI